MYQHTLMDMPLGVDTGLYRYSIFTTRYSKNSAGKIVHAYMVQCCFSNMNNTRNNNS